MVSEKLIEATGETRARRYKLISEVTDRDIELTPDLREDSVWRHDILPKLQGLPANVLLICQHGFTEMLNNAIDHSGSLAAKIIIVRNAAKVNLTIFRSRHRNLSKNPEGKAPRRSARSHLRVIEREAYDRSRESHRRGHFLHFSDVRSLQRHVRHLQSILLASGGRLVVRLSRLQRGNQNCSYFRQGHMRHDGHKLL